MVPEAPLEQTGQGLAPKGEGWFVLNARDAVWKQADGRGALTKFEGDVKFPQVGLNIYVLQPGDPMSMYHWEVDQEDFLIVSGEALLIIEGEERPLREWDFVHCPAEAKHVIVGAGTERCVVLAVGARGQSTGPNWGGYTVEEVALKHRAGVERETSDEEEAYAPVPTRQPVRYRDGWL